MAHPADTIIRLRLMVAADTDPELSAEDVDVLLDLAARQDSAGREPSAVGWTPTYALGYAAAEGWRVKAGRVANRVDLQGDDTRLARNQLFQACMQMATRYDRRAWATTPLDVPADARLLAEFPGWAPLIETTHTVEPLPSPLALPGAEVRGDNTW